MGIEPDFAVVFQRPRVQKYYREVGLDAHVPPECLPEPAEGPEL